MRGHFYFLNFIFVKDSSTAVLFLEQYIKVFNYIHEGSGFWCPLVELI